MTILISFQIYQLKGVFDFIMNIGTALFLQLQSKGNIVCNTHMRKQRVLLKHRVDVTFVGRQSSDILSLKNHTPLIGHDKSADHTQRCGLPASGRSQQSHKLIFTDIDAQIIQYLFPVKRL